MLSAGSRAFAVGMSALLKALAFSPADVVPAKVNFEEWERSVKSKRRQGMTKVKRVRRRTRSYHGVCHLTPSVPRSDGARQGATQAKSRVSWRDSPTNFALLQWEKLSYQKRMAYPTHDQTGPCLAPSCQMLRASVFIQNGSAKTIHIL